MAKAVIYDPETVEMHVGGLHFALSESPFPEPPAGGQAKLEYETTLTFASGSNMQAFVDKCLAVLPYCGRRLSRAQCAKLEGTDADG